MKLLRLICSFHWNHSLLSIAAAGDPRIIPWNFITDLLHESIYHILYLIFFYLSSPISAFLSGILKKKPVFSPFSVFFLGRCASASCFPQFPFFPHPVFPLFPQILFSHFLFFKIRHITQFFPLSSLNSFLFFVRYATFFSVFFPLSSSV